jgi:NAD(P)-dependent dehydrogenase (short-subunit alcohol dehydrogenase family)
MLALTDKNIAVVGGSRGVGRRIVEAARSNGGRVLAIARHEGPLKQVQNEVTGVEILSLDATEDDAALKVFDAFEPGILAICAGAFPPAAPFHQQSWQEFGVNWATDVKIAFNFCKAAISRPLPMGTLIVLISSGAALAGSPNSGGYAGAKRTQLFIANYAQKESDRLGLGLRFISLAPRIMPDTNLGKHAIAGYSRYLGMPPSDFVRGMSSPPTSLHVATAFVELATNAARVEGSTFIVSGRGLEAVPQ